MSTTATVETLTAEVRVLMVGNRQVTQSVAKQLDHVTLDRIEPFGRVRVKIDYGEDYVIGRDRESGALVLAGYRTTAGSRIPEVTRDECPLTDSELPKACQQLLSGFRAATASGIPFWMHKSIVQKDFACICRRPKPGAKPCTRGYKAPESFLGFIEDRVPAMVAQVEREDAPHVAAQALPLIVLAGLR